MHASSRTYAILGVMIGIALLIPLALNARALFGGACASPLVHAVFGTSIFGDICPETPSIPALPADTQPQGDSNTVTSGARGISCPSTALAGSPVSISWSCGTAALAAVAGF